VWTGGSGVGAAVPGVPQGLTHCWGFSGGLQVVEEGCEEVAEGGRVESLRSEGSVAPGGLVCSRGNSCEGGFVGGRNGFGERENGVRVFYIVDGESS